MFKFPYRLSLRAFLLAVVIVGTAAGLSGRYLTKDSSRHAFFQPEGHHKGFAQFSSSRLDAHPKVIVIASTSATLAVEFDNSTWHLGHLPSEVCDARLRIEKNGAMQFNGEWVAVTPGKRVWIFTADRKLVPVGGDEAFLQDVRYSNLKQFDQTSVYRNRWKPLLDAEWKKSWKKSS
jgi:hypothetical protein